MKRVKKSKKDEKNEKEMENDIKLYTDNIEHGQCYYEPLQQMVPILNNWRKESSLELEIRIGYYNVLKNKFVPEVSKDLFEKIKGKLEILEHKSYETVDQFDENHVRKSTQVLIKKERLSTIDYKFNGTPFDIRIALNKETKATNFGQVVLIRNKSRTTYYQTNDDYKLGFDLTKVITSTVDGEKTENYEIEIELITELDELLKTMKFKNDTFKLCYIIHDMLLKVRDFSKMCEEIEADCEFKRIKE
jgi:hypothetical protein